jgi:lambda family phage portal protein
MSLRLPFGLVVSKPSGGSVRAARRESVSRWRERERIIEVAAAEVSDLVRDWVTGAVPIGEILRRHLNIVRARSREQRRNNPYITGLVSRTPRQVLGPTGIGIEWRVMDSSGQLDERLNRVIQDRFRAWGEDNKWCDLEQQLDWPQIQDLWLKSVITDGEALVCKYTGLDFGPQAFAVQFLDPAMLDVSYDEDLPGSRRVRHGIQFDAHMRRMGYWFDQVNDRFGVQVGTRRAFVPARQVQHGFIKDEVKQYRGLPWAMSALVRLMMLGKYQEAALIAARIGASKLGFFERPEDDGQSRSADIPGDTKDDEGNAVEELEPGTSRALPPGWKWNGWDPTYPHGEMPQFQKAMLYASAIGLNVSYGTFSGDMSDGNFAAQRLARNGENESLAWIQRFTGTDLIRPIVNDWLGVQLMIGGFVLDGRPLGVEHLSAVARYELMPPGWDYVNPVDDVQSDGMKLGWGLDSHSAVVRRRTGRSLDTIIEEISRDRKKFKDAGIELSEFSRPDPTKVIVKES